MNLRGLIAAAAATLIVLGLWGSPAGGQFVSPSGTGEITLKVAQFGLQGFGRGGDWAGIELKVTDSAQQPRNVILGISTPDGDGDSAQAQRVIVANPGIEQSAWLYARLPFNVGQGSTFRITAHEAIDADETAEGLERHTPGRLLASLVYPAQIQIAPTNGLIAVVGRRSTGLEQYSAVSAQNLAYAPTGHEYTKIATGLDPASMPDRWAGWSSFEALVWAVADTANQPLRLTAPQADALREWIERGGHLIVIMPPAGQAWLDTPGNPLAALMPDVTLTRGDGINLNDYRQLLTRRADVALPNNAVVHYFTPRPGSERYSAIPILNTPDGQTVVVRKLVGTGAVTLIGIDVTANALTGINGALHADLFWHRVLGKRLPLLSPAEFDAEQRPVAQPGSATIPPPKWLSSRAEADLDGVIGPAITRSAQAAAGLLLAFIVFLLYWLLAGPVGFYALKERKLKHYSWLGFVAAAGIFTAISWGGANMLRTRKVEGQHLTFVDHVYGQSNQRMRSWFTLMLPSYGSQRVAVGEAADTDRWRHLLTSWESESGTGGAGLASFPDARPYMVDARAPWRLDVPARATTKTFQADWAGGLPANWGMITPQSADGGQVGLGEELQLVRDPDTVSRWRLSGKLVHSLPAALEDVTIIVCLGQSTLEPPRATKMIYSDGRLQAMAWDFTTPKNQPWKPGEVLDLAAVTGSDGSAARLAIDNFFANKVPRPPANFGGASPQELALRNVSESLTTLALFSIVPPPVPTMTGAQTLVRRSAAHNYDLSRWFTQPCVIVIGHLADDGQSQGVETPLPLSVDGSLSDATRKRVLGRTVVRWVYPLPPAPPRFAQPLPLSEESPVSGEQPEPASETDAEQQP